MAEPLHILILEDNRTDAELTLFELEDAGFSVSAKVVETEKDYIRELQESCFDLILSDYDLPQYNGAQALQEATRRCPDTPFILVSGVVTEDRAIEILTQGAKDYVLKSRLQQRLIPAVRRALTEANEQRARKKAEEELREAHKNLERQVNERTLQLQKELERRRQIEATLLRYNERLEILSYTSARLLASDRPQQIVEELCLKVMAFLDCQTFFNFLVDETAGRLHLNACAGIPSETAREIEWLDFGVAVCGCVARDGLRIIAENIPQTPDVRTELIKSFGIKAYACHPLMQQDRVIGTLSFGTRARTTFNADELALMKAVADQVAMAMSRVRMEDALRESEARAKRHAGEIQAVMDLAPIAVWIAHDPECLNITGNRYANEIMHVSPDANISAGAPPGDAAVSYKVMRGGKEMKPVELPAQVAARTGKPVEAELLDLVFSDGRVVKMIFGAVPLVDSEGRISGAVTTGTDVTRLRQTEETLLQMTERFEMAQHAAGVGTWDWNIVAGRLEWSRQMFDLFGLNPLKSEASFEVWRSALHPEDLQTAEERIGQSLHQKTPLNNEYRIILPDGRIRWINAIGEGKYDETGSPVRMIGICIDITERKLAEEAVSRSRQTFSELVERAPFGIYTVDSGFRIAQMNMGSQNGAFRNVRPVIGRNFAEAMRILWPEPVASDIIAAFRHTLDTGESYYSPRFTNPRHDAAIVESYEWELHRMRLPDGQYGVICYYFDSTKLREAEAALSESEERFRRYFELGLIGMGVTTPDKGITEANEKFCEMTGYEKSELLQMTWAELTHPDDLDKDISYFNRVMDGELEGYSIEKRFIRKGGGVLDAILAVRCVRTAQGSIDSFLALVQDVTERKRIEAAILRAKEEWERTFDTLPDLIAILDNQHRIVRVNKAMAGRLGVAPERCVGLHCHDAVHGMGKPPAFCPHSLTCGDGLQHVAEVHEPHLGGDFLVSTTPLCDSSGQLIGSVHVSRDITARKAAEDQLAKQAAELQERTAQLEEANRELESFSYSVSHDLRAPLRAIDGISRIILRKQGDQLDETTRRQFDMVRENACKMSMLIDKLLAFSRVHKTGMNAAVIDMEKLAKEVWEEIRQVNTEREMEFRINGLLPGYGDQALIRQVLYNLLDNAVKFTKNRKPGIVEVTSTEDSGKTIYAVKDNGAGFDMEYADKLFGVFQRLHSADQYEGTGVGLAIVQRIINRHGGRVWGEGREDEGASFYFSLSSIDAQRERAAEK